MTRETSPVVVWGIFFFFLICQQVWKMLGVWQLKNFVCIHPKCRTRLSLLFIWKYRDASLRLKYLFCFTGRFVWPSASHMVPTLLITSHLPQVKKSTSGSRRGDNASNKVKFSWSQWIALRGRWLRRDGRSRWWLKMRKGGINVQTRFLKQRVNSGQSESGWETLGRRERINPQPGLYLAAVSHNQQPY